MMKSLKIIIGIILIIIASLVGLILFMTQNESDINISTFDLPEQVEEISVSDSLQEQIKENNNSLIANVNDKKEEDLKKLKSQVVTFAIFGTDERANETPRSDVIMVVKYYPMDDHMLIISIPRDTKVMIPNKYEDKINHAYAFGGAELLENTLEGLFEIDIDYYIKLSFTNFKELVDDLGGIEIDVAKKYDYPGYIDIEKGYQVLNGVKALEYVRFRYDKDGDQGRIKRQQEVLISILQGQKTQKENEMISLIDEFYLNITTDIPLRNFIDYYHLLKDVEKYSFDTNTLKTSGQIIEGIWYEIMDMDHLDQMKLKLKENR